MVEKGVSKSLSLLIIDNDIGELMMPKIKSCRFLFLMGQRENGWRL